MNKKLTIILSLALGLFSLSAFAEKVVVFDIKGAVLGSQQAQSKIQELKADSDFKSLIKNAEGLQAQLAELSKERETKGLTWSKEELSENQKKIEYVQADFQLAVKKLKAEENAVFNAIMEELQPAAVAELKKIVAADGIGLVLKVEAAIHASELYDITERVTVAIDKRK